MGLLMARKYGVKLVDSIQAALCYDAATGEVGSELAVDGILAIGEHGDYPVNAKGQRLYPRRHFWEQITGVLATSERRSQIPIFSECPLALPFPALPSVHSRMLPGSGQAPRGDVGGRQVDLRHRQGAGPRAHGGLLRAALLLA